MAVFCTSCGAQLADQARFCDRCGASQPDRSKSADPGPAAPVSASPPAYSSPPPAPAPGSAPPPPPTLSPPFRDTRLGPYPAQPGPTSTGFAGLIDFSGRVGRFDYWMTAIVTTIAGAIVSGVSNETDNAVVLLTLFVIWLATFIVSLSVDVKRWHDRDKSGWWMLILLIPVIGWIWALIEMGFLPGTPGPNRFGEPESGWPF